ncbi:MAG TPA: helix-turn-helix transcriptional regulator [Acidimicrobiales bacterium]
MRHGLVQADLAQRVGVTQQTVSKWINGETVPRAKLLPLIEEATGAERGELSRLIFGDDPGPVPPGRPTSDLAALNKKLTRLQPHELAKVEAYVDGVFDSRS